VSVPKIDINTLSTGTSTNTHIRAIDIQNSTISLTISDVTGGDTSKVFSVGTTGVIAEFKTSGSSIILTDSSSGLKSFLGGNETYNIVQFSPGSGTGEFQITGSNTFNQLKDDGTANHTIKFTKSTTQTIADWQIGTATSRAGNTNVITLDTVDGAGTFTLVKTGGGVINADYLSVTRSTVTPSNAWYAGSHSTDGGTNTGWIFKAPPSGSKNKLLLFGVK